MIQSKIIKGTVFALSPIVHNEILSMDATKAAGKGNAKPQRKMSFILKDGNEEKKLEVPVVSGNSIRGIGRRLLVDFSFDTLDTSLEELFDKVEDQKRVAFFFRNGGLTPKGMSISPAAVGAYEKIHCIPFLGLLGSVYMGHHFEGSMCVGTLLPIIKETKEFINDKDVINDEPIPTLDQITADDNIVRYTRRASDNVVVENEDENKDNKEKDKEAMIYATAVIPAGTKFYSYNTCHTDNEGVLLAFQAFFALLSNYGYIGGMSGRGHGQCKFDYSLDVNEAISKYQEYLLQNKEEIIEAIKMIPSTFTATKKDKKKDKKGKAQE